jgi:hypothetical protein
VRITRKKRPEAPLMRKLVQSVLDFLLRSGMSPSDVRSILEECQPVEKGGKAMSRTALRDSNRVGNGDVSAEVMRIWHRNSRFLDREANPRPLQLNRGSNSLVALVRRLDPSGDPISSIKVMRAVGLIRRMPDGRYVPTAESVKIDHLHPLAIEHIAKSVVRLVTTVCRNTDPTRQAMPLIERYAYAPDMSRSEAAAFADFTRNQGMVYLEAVDDWLEQRRIRSKAVSAGRRQRSSVAAGVHLFAYMDDLASPASTGSFRPGRRAPATQPLVAPS